MLQYNPKATIITINRPVKDKIMVELQNKCPLVINDIPNTFGLTIEHMNYGIPGYIINDKDTLISLHQLHNSTSINIHRNSKLIDDYNLQDNLTHTTELFSDYMSSPPEYSLSLYRGTQHIPLTKNYRETLLIQPISGKVIIFLFNPKHELDIKGLEPSSIKKWAVKLDITDTQLVYVPPEWSYFYESSEESIVSHIEFDSYQSYLFNYIRKK